MFDRTRSLSNASLSSYINVLIDRLGSSKSVQAKIKMILWSSAIRSADRPRKTHPSTKRGVDWTTRWGRCRDMAIRNFSTWWPAAGRHVTKLETWSHDPDHAHF